LFEESESLSRMASNSSAKGNIGKDKLIAYLIKKGINITKDQNKNLKVANNAISNAGRQMFKTGTKSIILSSSVNKENIPVK